MVETMKINIKRQNPKVSDNAKTPQEQLAETIGISVDTLNNYKKLTEMCRKHNIDYPIEELDLGEDVTIIDVMEWMINTQLGRRNLPPAQRIAVWDKFRRIVEDDNAKKKSEKISLSNKNRKSNDVQLDNNELIKNDTSNYTRQQIAQKANVGSGTIARYDKVMNSDNEEIKKKMENGELSINTAYEKVREQEKKKENINNEQQISQPKTYQNDSKIRFETEKYIV